MANPWDEYQQAAPAAAGPWTEYDQRAKPAPAPPARVNTAEGMSAGEKALVGIGSSMNKAWEGLSDPFVGEDTRKRRKEDRDLYAKNKGDLGGWGTAGEVVGDIASYAPLALIPGGLAVQAGVGAAGSAAMTPGSLEERAKAGAMGAGGAAVGHGLTKALARVAKPIGDKAADTVALEAMNVKPTFGQGMQQKDTALGRAVGRAEEGAMSVPLASGPLRKARRAGQDQWLQATRDVAAAPGKTGAKTVDEVGQGYTESYTKVLGDNPFPQSGREFLTEDAIARAARGKPVNRGQRADALEYVQDVIDRNVEAAGSRAAGAHAAESELKKTAAEFTASQDPAQKAYGRMLADVAEEFRGAWRSGLKPEVQQGLRAIDKQYPNVLAIKDAARKVGAAASDSNPNQYTPAVLTRAGRTVDRSPGKSNYIAQQAPMQEMARLGQTMQGKVPDSGTTERMLGLGGLGGAAALGQLPATLAGGGALAAYGTKPVQNYLMGRAAPTAQEFMLQLLRQGAPYGAAAGASQTAD